MMENNEFKNIERIEHFLAGSMSKEDADVFQNDLNNVKNLFDEFQAYKSSNNILHINPLVDTNPPQKGLQAVGVNTGNSACSFTRNDAIFSSHSLLAFHVEMCSCCGLPTPQ